MAIKVESLNDTGSGRRCGKNQDSMSGRRSVLDVHEANERAEKSTWSYGIDSNISNNAKSLCSNITAVLLCRRAV
jgi:hypothetical protein